MIGLITITTLTFSTADSPIKPVHCKFVRYRHHNAASVARGYWKWMDGYKHAMCFYFVNVNRNHFSPEGFFRFIHSASNKTSSLSLVCDRTMQVTRFSSLSRFQKCPNVTITVSTFSNSFAKCNSIRIAVFYSFGSRTLATYSWLS